MLSTPIFISDGPGYGENCTTIMVGRRASSDGSVMTSHSCDGNYQNDGLKFTLIKNLIRVALQPGLQWDASH